MDTSLILAIAIGIDAVIGDPDVIYRRVAHPVVLIGRTVDALERRFNREVDSDRQRFWKGAGVSASVISLSALLAIALDATLPAHPISWLVESIIVATLLAARSLHEHVREVALALGRDLAAGRRAVSRIVGRDPNRLDEAGVARAAIESAAENFSDGFVAPVLWYAVLGLPGLFAYKAINTLDSMIGHRNARFEHFGKAAARIDDVANWAPARLTGVVFCISAALVPGAEPTRGLRTMWRDAPRHRSLNAGWCEAAMAGALGYALAGPRHYATGSVVDPWMGDGRADLGAADISRSLYLCRMSWGVVAAVTVSAALV